MAKNANLQNAKTAKKDEFYTQLTDIEKELKHYRKHFQNKIVLCNCDDPRVSNFFKYFVLNFNFLGLKEVIATCYKSDNADLFSENKSEQAVYLSVTKETLKVIAAKHGGAITVDSFKDITALPLNGNGDFRSPECVKFLERADIVCTNPPFSLFREYVELLFKLEKKFLIIGNVNAITYKDFFQKIKNGEAWMGASIHSGDREFGVPDDYPLNAAGFRIDSNGKKFIRIKGVRWFTNLDYQSRHTPLALYKKFNPVEYPKYDNYDAVEVSKVENIPLDYSGVLGVPITFLDKHCPEQFEIVGMAKRGAGDPALKSKVYTKDDYPNYSDLNATPVLIDANGIPKNTYPRILIKSKL